MVNYQNGKIYRIVCNVTGKQYIGSTISSLNTRLSQHKKYIKDGKYCSSKIVLEEGDYDIVLIEDFPCERKEQLLQRERYYIETIECVNKKIPTRTQAEWYIDNKERLIEKQMLWNNTNKDKLKEYQKTFKNKNKGLLVDLTEVNVDDEEQIKLSIEDIYESKEYFDENEIMIDLMNKNIII